MIVLLSVRDGGSGRLVDQPAGAEPLQRQAGIELCAPRRGRSDAAKRLAEPGVALKPPVPQPQLT